MKGRSHLGDIDVDGKIILKWMLQKQGLRTSTGFHLLKIKTSGGVL
jgi:hypothetical protein